MNYAFAKLLLVRLYGGFRVLTTVSLALLQVHSQLTRYAIYTFNLLSSRKISMNFFNCSWDLG